MTPLGADRDVVDVPPPAAWNTPVVEHDRVAAMQADVERAGGGGFALGALAPGVDVVRFAGERSESRADGSVPGSDALASRLLAARVLALRARPGAALQVVVVGLGHGIGD